MKPSSYGRPLKTASFYLLLVLLAMCLGGILPRGNLLFSALAELPLLLAMLLPTLTEKERGRPLLRKPQNGLFVLPLFFLLPLCSLLIAAGWGQIVPPSPSDTSLPLWYGLLFSALLPALFEELFFRHYLLSSLRGEGGYGGAVLLSALLFALLHADFYQMPYAFVAGLLLGIAALASGSFLLPCAMHLGNNLCSLLLAPVLPLPLLAGGLLGLFLLSAAVLLLYKRRKGEPLLPDALKSCLADKGGRRALFLGALRSPLWLFLILTVLFALWKG
ncbi:MAG: CPBP family intramembrane metalloprotease [Clostridia bacterium]|nr:CPBP family intramembrane metalloprotease [Clostridia bacterium]